MVCVTQCNRFVKQKGPADAGPFDHDIPQIEAVDRHISHALKCKFSYNIHFICFFLIPVSTVQINAQQDRESMHHQKLATLIWITFNDSAFSPVEDNHDR